MYNMLIGKTEYHERVINLKKFITFINALSTFKRFSSIIRTRPNSSSILAFIFEFCRKISSKIVWIPFPSDSPYELLIGCVFLFFFKVLAVGAGVVEVGARIVEKGSAPEIILLKDSLVFTNFLLLLDISRKNLFN